jgi:hypothetical protein
VSPPAHSKALIAKDEVDVPRGMKEEEERIFAQEAPDCRCTPMFHPHISSVDLYHPAEYVLMPRAGAHPCSPPNGESCWAPRSAGGRRECQIRLLRPLLVVRPRKLEVAMAFVGETRSSSRAGRGKTSRKGRDGTGDAVWEYWEEI